MLPRDLSTVMPEGCYVCGADKFEHRNVLWPALVDEWQLAPDEVEYINVQQGFRCKDCGNYLRSMVLARAICEAMSHAPPLTSWLSSPSGSAAAILEINEAGGLTQFLRHSAGHRLASYPEVDIHRLPFEEGSFDLVLHSDTLEHVPNPVQALAECRRVLRTGGVLAFTVPIVIGRMTRSRAGLPPSFHGDALEGRFDMLVQTEFGADAWTMLPSVGFRQMAIHADLFPAGLALTARK